MSFAKNFLVAFAFFLGGACLALGVTLGPIFFLISLGIEAFPYGLPIYLVFWCAVGGLIAALTQEVEP